MAGTASAESALDTIAGLRAQGYSVQINGGPGDALSECTVTSISGATPANAGGIVLVDTACRGGC